jgi:hypothetical protein
MIQDIILSIKLSDKYGSGTADAWPRYHAYSLLIPQLRGMDCGSLTAFSMNCLITAGKLPRTGTLCPVQGYSQRHQTDDCEVPTFVVPYQRRIVEQCTQSDGIGGANDHVTIVDG